MAYDTLKAEIRQYIQTNGQQEITGQILQNVLLDMVNAYPSLDGYATQQWVSNQLSDMATMTWVGQNFVQNSALNNYLQLSGGVMTGLITAGTLSTGSYSLGNTGLSFEYSYNGNPRYAHAIRISSVDGTITFIGRGGASTGTVIDGDKITSDKFIVTNGTSAQFLKADGSVDNTSYLPLIGGMIKGISNDYKVIIAPDGISAQYSDSSLDTDTITEISSAGIYFKETDEEFIRIYKSNTQLRIQLEEGDYASIKAGSFIKDGGTSSQFLKADGSVDNNTYLSSADLSGYATETWVGSNYLPLTGGTITSNLSVNGELDSFSRMQVNGTSADKPFLRLHIPNVNWTRLQMDTYGVIHVLDGFYDASYNGFACGNATMDNITLGRSTSGYGSIRFRPDDFVKIYREGSDDSLVLCADSTAGGGIVLSSSETNPVSIITDIQGGTSNTMNWYIYNSGDAQFVSVTQTSDIRRKNIISDIGIAIDDIAKAPMFRFTMKDDDEGIVRVGTSAQYWQTVIPEVVSEDKRGVLGLQYDVAALAGVITVAKRVVDHEQRIAELEKENALLKAKLNIN